MCAKFAKSAPKRKTKRYQIRVSTLQPTVSTQNDEGENTKKTKNQPEICASLLGEKLPKDDHNAKSMPGHYLASIHDERPVLNDRFVRRLSGDEHEVRWGVKSLHEDP